MAPYGSVVGVCGDRGRRRRGSADRGQRTGSSRQGQPRQNRVAARDSVHVLALVGALVDSLVGRLGEDEQGDPGAFLEFDRVVDLE